LNGNNGARLQRAKGFAQTVGTNATDTVFLEGAVDDASPSFDEKRRGSPPPEFI